MAKLTGVAHLRRVVAKFDWFLSHLEVPFIASQLKLPQETAAKGLK